MATPSLSRLPHRCALKLQAVYDGLSKAERRAADYLLAHPEGIPWGARAGNPPRGARPWRAPRSAWSLSAPRWGDSAEAGGGH